MGTQQKHVVYLFGTKSYNAVPDAIENHIKAIIQQTNGEVEFIVGDGAGLDSAYHRVLSGLGAGSKTTIYGMDKARHNTYDFKTKIFNSMYDPEKFEASIVYENNVLEIFDKVNKPEELLINPDYQRFLDKQMIRDCTFAICFWDGTTKTTERLIDTLSAVGKYCYVYKAN